MGVRYEDAVVRRRERVGAGDGYGETVWYDPVLLLQAVWHVPADALAHLTVDPALAMHAASFRITRGVTHDGLVASTHDLLARVLAPVFGKYACHTADVAAWNAGAFDDVRYTVGLLRHTTVRPVDGVVTLPVGRYPGQRERARLPVVAHLTPAQRY